MPLAELLPMVYALPHEDKLRLKQILDAKVDEEEEIARVLLPGEYPIWSPFISYEAAYLLQKMLEQEKEKFREQAEP